MEIYDLYADPFNLGDIRNSLKEEEVIEDPYSGDKYIVVDVDNIGEYIVIERVRPVKVIRIHEDQEYMVQYCEWDKQWYAWGTEWNLNLSDETKEGAIKKFESLIDFFCLYEYPFLPDSSIRQIKNKWSWGNE